ncbi:MAG: M56 family metallopeptidase [Eubacteriales bacterium]|nr:M56 family metallopeptidase [Eubacteriales bacterium]
MNILIRLEVMLLLNLITGSLAFFLWLCFARLGKGFAAVQYLHTGLKWVLLSFAVPVMYFLQCIRFRGCDGAWNGAFLQSTPGILKVGSALGLVWFCGLIVQSLWCGADLYRENAIFRTYEKGSGEEEAALRSVARSMQIRKEIPVRIGSYHLPPAIGGLVCTRLYLGRHAYPEEELRIVFRHELAHYKHGDLWFRRCYLLIRILFWFHPLFFTGIFEDIYERVSEKYCDDTVCQAESRDAYIRVLLKTAIAGADRRYVLGSGIAETRCEVLRRVQDIKNFETLKKPDHFLAKQVTALFVCMAAVVSYAAGGMLVDGYVKWENETEVTFRELTDGNFDIQEASGADEFTWELDARMWKSGAAFKKETADFIDVSADITPGNITVDVGIIEPDGTKRYVTASDHLEHRFLVKEKGTYRIYVENRSVREVRVTGSYIK